MSAKSYNSSTCFLCKNSPTKTPGISMHRFPSCAQKRQVWLKMCNLTERDYRPSRKICSDHFDTNCYNPNYARKYLIKGSIPTIFVKKGQGCSRIKKEPEEQSMKPVVIKQELPIKKKPFCPSTMVRYDNTLNPYSRTQWVCRKCLSVMFSEDAVHKHLKKLCGHRNDADFRPNFVHDDDDEGNNEDDGASQSCKLRSNDDSHLPSCSKIFTC